MRIGILSISGTMSMIALALGYIVLTLADKEKGRLKGWGYIIGVAIMITSSVLILAKVLWIATGATKCDRMLMRQKMMMQREPLLKEMPAAPAKLKK